MRIPAILALLTITAIPAIAGTPTETNRKLGLDDFRVLVGQCAPGAAFDTMLAVATTESALRIDAISLNRPKQAAKKSGYMHHRIEILRQPHDLAEALHWMNWFAQRRYTVSVGLMQVNIENAPLYGLRPEQLFDPCTNIAVGADLLARSYHEALRQRSPSHDPALDAISAYNSGSYHEGYTNGYVGSVMNNKRRAPARR